MSPIWVDDFASFRSWSVSNGYAHNLQIDRIKNNRGYSPTNCRWATRIQNMQNNDIFIRTESLLKKIKKLRDAGISFVKTAQKLGVSKSTIERAVYLQIK